MSFPVAPLLASLAVLAVAGCAATTPSSPGAVASPSALTSSAPMPTPVPTQVPTAALEADPTPTLNAGDVRDPGTGPQLTVEQAGVGVINVRIEDPDAKAWRIVVGGAGEQADDRVEIVVEVGDVTPVITTTEIVAGQVADRVDMSGYLDETAITGTCHPTLGVCVDSSAFRFSEDGTGRLVVRLQLPGAHPARLLVTGGTAGWPSEPFILGPWTDTAPFPWAAS